MTEIQSEMCGTQVNLTEGEDGWMDGRMDGWMDGWKDGWMDGWKYDDLQKHSLLLRRCEHQHMRSL